MSTRSRIGIQLEDGSVLSAYHHWDGYPEWLGRVLLRHYNSYDKAKALIDGGDMSSAWTTDRWDDSADGTKLPQYYSQRGEDCPPREDTNLTAYLKDGEQYAYLFTGGEWTCFELHQFDDSKGPELVPIPATTEEFE